jgi:hypothetical protein
VKVKKYSQANVCSKCLVDEKIIIKEFLNETPINVICKTLRQPGWHIVQTIKKFKKLNCDFEPLSCKMCDNEKILYKPKRLWVHINRVHDVSHEDYFGHFPNEKVQIQEIGPKQLKTPKEEYLKKGQIVESMQCPKIRRHCKPMNLPENLIRLTFENLLFVGGSFKNTKRLWVYTSQKRNPDFVVITDKDYLLSLKSLTPEIIQDKVSNDFIKKEINIRKVVEFCGLYWHSQNFNGRTIEQYELDMINDYKIAKIQCLVVWDFELKKIDFLKHKVNDFIVNDYEP